MTKNRAESFVWVVLFILLGLMILGNLPDDPAPTGLWFLLGAGSIVVGVAGLVIELFGYRRGR